MDIDYQRKLAEKKKKIAFLFQGSLCRNKLIVHRVTVRGSQHLSSWISYTKSTHSLPWYPNLSNQLHNLNISCKMLPALQRQSTGPSVKCSQFLCLWGSPCPEYNSWEIYVLATTSYFSTFHVFIFYKPPLEKIVVPLFNFPTLDVVSHSEIMVIHFKENTVP